MIYEVRTYTLRPGTIAEFEERFAKRTDSVLPCAVVGCGRRMRKVSLGA